MPESILVIEDTPLIARMIGAGLEESGFTIHHASDGQSGLDLLQSSRIDLVILDLTLPDIDGLAVCRTIRSQGNCVPIIMLTGRKSEQDIVLGLELGADDYLTKPFSLPELTARIRNILRRSEPPHRKPSHSAPPHLLNAGDLSIDLDKRYVYLGRDQITLTAKEFDLLAHLARHPGRVFSREQLLNDIWGYNFTGYEHTVTTHINSLRKKIEKTPSNPAYILTVWGVGYRFSECPAI